MTRPRGLADSGHPVAVLAAHGAPSALAAAGVTDFVILDEPVAQVQSAFDDGTDTWLLTTAGGEVVRARAVITAEPPFVPWLPDIAGRDDFPGPSFHAAALAPEFDPSGKRIALVGTDASAGHHIGRLTRVAASVTVFAHSPRRVVTEVPLFSTRVKRRLRHPLRPAAAHRPSIKLAGSPIAAVTASGIRTYDGVEHCVDAIVYGTGFSIPQELADATLVGAGGLTIRQAWHDGMEPFCGVAARGFPNYFFIIGPDTGAQARYIAECLLLMKRTASSRIEVRASSLRVFNERAQLTPGQAPPVASAFDLSANAPERDDTFDGTATLEIAGARHPVRVRLTGHLDPIDGRYHWQGTVFASPSRPLPDEALGLARSVTLTVGRRSATARIVERTPWGTHSVAGVGAPPYASG